MPSFKTDDAVTITYNVEGQGVPVLLVHGWSGSSKYFQLNVPQLVQAGCKVVTYDQRFHGESEKPAYGYHIARLAADLRDLLAELQLDGVVVVGTSMGCSVIWSYMELFGGKGLAKAVFVDQAPLQNVAPDWTTGSKGCFDEASLKQLQAALKSDMNAFAQGNLECCATLPINEAVCQSLHEETLKCCPDDLGKLMGDHTQLDWRPQLRRISIPCLNCIGCQSGVFPVQGSEEVSKLIPECKTVYFLHANHWLYLEAPQAFNSILSTFAKSGDTGVLPEGVSGQAPA